MSRNNYSKFSNDHEAQALAEHCRRLEVKNQLLKGENNALKREKKNNLQAEFIVDEFHNALQLAVPAFKPLDRIVDVRSRPTSEEVLVVHLSDEHADELVIPERVNGMEEYNFNIACRRAERYVEGIIDWTQNQLNHDIREVTILCYGDHVSGTIHKGTENSHFRNQFANSLAVGQLHALMFRDLASLFDTVNVVYVVGNHGRVDPRKNMRRALENLDYLVAETASLCCKDIPNINFTIPDCYSAIVVINGHRFHVSHGDDVKSWAGIPWYGMSKRTSRIQSIHSETNQRIHYHVTGHFHTLGQIPTDTIRGEHFMNGSWKATDEYAYNELHVCRDPVQWIHGVSQNEGITWRRPIRLKYNDEQSGPKRYRPSLAASSLDKLIGA